MTTAVPEGEDLRKAVRWISEMRTEEPDTPLGRLIESASQKFDLSPKDENFLLSFFRGGGNQAG